MIEWTLNDLLVQYPSIKENNFQTLISAKKEFNELTSGINEPKPAKGEPYEHQLLFKRYMSHYNDMLILDQAGTGKTCELTFLTEYILDHHIKLLNDEVADIDLAHYKKTIILVKSESLITEFKNQLVNVCTKDRYDISKLKNENKIKPYKVVDNELKKWYEFHTYERFAKIIKGYKDDWSKLNVDYDHTVIVIDEAHNLFIEEVEKASDVTKKKKGSWNKEKTYHYLWLFLHQIRYCKKILSSATPMLNSVDEIGKILNLLLSMDNQMPILETDKNKLLHYYKNITVEELEKYCRGICTFVRAFDTGATRVDQINPKIKCRQCPKNLDIFLSRMSDFQSHAYERIYKEKGASLYSLYLNTISNFAYPDGSVDEPDKLPKVTKRDIDIIKKDAMKKIANYPIDDTDDSGNEEEDNYDEEEDVDEDEPEEKKKKKKSGYDKYVIETRSKGQIKYQLNKKAAPALVLETIEDVKKYSTKYAAILKSLDKSEGKNRFIYGKYNAGSGNIILSICLEEVLGYERYMEPDTVFVGGNIRPDYEKLPRFALLTSETIKNDNAYSSIMETFNSYENRHGDYIQCIIASRVARDGLTFKNVQDIDIIGPEYNPSAMYQAISRGIRSNSHIDLLNELIVPTLDIKVFKHAALPNNKIFDENLGADINIYEKAKKKEVDIDAMMIKLKQCTINCQIHKERNVRKGDLITYECVDPEPTEIDYSTYNAYYLEEDLQIILPIVIGIIQGLGMFTFERIAELLPNYTAPLLSVTLEYIVLNKVQILDHFGFIHYLYQDNNIYYMDKEYYNVASIDLAAYGNNLIVINNKADQYIEGLNVDSYDYFISLKDPTKIDEKFEKLSIDNKIKFLEEQFILKDKRYTHIVNLYIKMFFTAKEAKMVAKKAKEKKIGRPKATECGDIVHTKNTVYLNVLNLYKTTNNHNFISHYLGVKTTIRIYDDKNVGWRNCTTCENTLYQQELTAMNIERFDVLRTKYDNLFGFKIGHDMKIIYQEDTKKGKTQGVGRNEARGRACSSYKVDTLVTISKMLNIKNADQYTREQLCPIINETLINTNRMF
jgi:hypothetical protein